MRSSLSQVATASILLASGANALAVAHPHSSRSDTPDEFPLKIPGLPLPNATKSYWQDPPHRIANLRSTKDLPTDKTFDYVIIGSGISGAATAHKLLDRDSSLSILMIEARTAASGATGRNGGHCKPGDYNGVKAWVETYGEDDALRIANMEQDCVNDVRDFVRSHNISSDFTDVETASLYWTDDSFKAAVESIEFQHDLEKRRPDDVPKNKRTIWKGQDARDYWGWPEIVGAVTFKAHTQNPYHTVCGILEYSLEKGLNLQTKTMALSLNQLGRKTKAGAKWEVKTNRGTVKSKQVVLATNGFTPALHPGIASTNFTMPVRNQVSAVTPSANTTDNKVFRRSNSVPDLHSGNVYIAAQPPGAKNAGSVVIGGSTQMSPTRERYITDDTAINDQIAYVLHGAARTVYGYENWGGSTKVIQDWTGIVCETPDGFPLVGEVPAEDGLWAIVCMNGHGMAWAYRSAEALVGMMTEGKTPKWFPEQFKAQRAWEAQGNDELPSYLSQLQLHASIAPVTTMAPPELTINPPLLNSATPWATDINDLLAIASSPSTGAITTRTSLINGFAHQHEQHQYLFFNPGTVTPDQGTSSNQIPPSGHTEDAMASLNNLGYSPITLDGYLGFLSEISRRLPGLRKTFIVSVTGSPEDIKESYARIEIASKTLPFPLAMEVNLSCPNIPGAPPPAYGGAALKKYLDLLPENPSLPVGIKTPPYTHHGQFATLIETLLPTASSLSFITATNTLGSCLILENDKLEPQLPGTGVGGMAGPPLHPLALGNVSTLRKMLDQVPELSHIKIIGVGGVRDGDGYRRMRSVGAYAVAVGTGLGKQGPGVFERIERDLKGEWRVSSLKEKL
ncbi:oxidoreductase ordL [Fusarium phyllophilum]|uniref:Dihydroorotate dehydrogenase (fumarate) n=1 Tax=Fusarium phyllophilum TaxID=47803 RepID=A0A8H5JDK3_9HYPO|nr:oxidoreductase ordL [Fusarium phyllophilum]